MHYEVEVGGRRRQVTIAREGDSLAVTLDGRRALVDVARIDGHTLSLIVSRVWSKGDTGAPGAEPAAVQVHEVEIFPDVAPGRLVVGIGAMAVAVGLDGRRRTGGDGPAAAGSQRVTAPMPGKVVRLLVKRGQAVQPRQPLVVVEAMKMENELRAEKAATVSQIHVSEGASVEAGALLVVLE